MYYNQFWSTINPITPISPSEGPLTLLKIPLRFYSGSSGGGPCGGGPCGAGGGGHNICNHLPQSVPFMNYSIVLLSRMPDFPI